MAFCVRRDMAQTNSSRYAMTDMAQEFLVNVIGLSPQEFIGKFESYTVAGPKSM